MSTLEPHSEQSDIEDNSGTGQATSKMQVLHDYHERSKHHLERYAAGPEALDWDAQPNPFREFAETRKINLLLPAKKFHYAYKQLYKNEAPTAKALNLTNLAALFQLSLGLSAWKQYGPDRWSLRVNPSSGNLHPTEAYVVLPYSIDDTEAGVYHYGVYEHCLQQRCRFKQGNIEIENSDSFFIGLSSIHWREAWKYGERAFRYCQHDVGHAIAALRYAAAILGWQVRLVENASDEQIAQLLGLDRAEDFNGVEHESPDLLLWVTTLQQQETSLYEADALLDWLLTAKTEWYGKANLLDPNPMYQWPIIDEIAHATEKPLSNEKYIDQTVLTTPTLTCYPHEPDAVDIVLHRRSAQAFAPNHSMSEETLLTILDKTLPRNNIPPFDTLPWPARIHLLIFIHRVDGFTPGVYLLVRNHRTQAILKGAMRKDFDWVAADHLNGNLPLYHLVSAKAQNAARTLGCHQAIASDGMVSFSMLAKYDEIIDKHPWRYRQLYWEAGMVGQSLYLEAEAHQLRGTGIGCYFDDAVHEMLGIQDQHFQCLYQFTLGMPIIDQRITSLPPYGHLHREPG